MAEQEPARSARLWDEVEDSVRQDTAAISERIALARRALAKGSPIIVKDDDIVPNVQRYVSPEVLDDVHSTQPSPGVTQAVDELLATMADAAVLRLVATGARGLVDDVEKVAERAGGDIAETIELHLGLGLGRYGLGLDGFEARRQFLAQEVDTAWAEGEPNPYTATVLAERLETTRARWSAGFQLLGLPRADTHPGVLELGHLARAEHSQEAAPLLSSEVAHATVGPTPAPPAGPAVQSVLLEIAPVVPRIAHRGPGRPEDSAVARQTAEGAHFANLLTDVERFLFGHESSGWEVESINASHSGAGFGIEVRLRGEPAALSPDDAAPRLYEALRGAGIAAIVRPA